MLRYLFDFRGKLITFADMESSVSATTSNPLLTVVIPVYNRAAIVGATLDSLERQTLRPLRVILVDNNSSDGSLETLRRWRDRVDAPDFRVRVLSESTPGAPAARNCGLREVDTPYTMFFDSDDRMLPEHCSRAVEAFLRHPDADVVGWDCVAESSAGSKSIRRFYTRNLMWNNIFHGGFSTQRYAARTELFRNAGWWDETSRGWDDAELGCRILNLSPKIVKSGGRPTVIIVETAVSITGVSFKASAPVWEHTLDLMEGSAPARIVNMRRALLAGDYKREKAPGEGRRLLNITLSKEKNPFQRFLLRLTYNYRGTGLPGISHMLHLFS